VHTHRSLLKPPFSVAPPPVQTIDEETVDGKHLLVFDVSVMTFGPPARRRR
jgi:hypothetical protein